MSGKFHTIKLCFMSRTAEALHKMSVHTSQYLTNSPIQRLSCGLCLEHGESSTSREEEEAEGRPRKAKSEQASSSVLVVKTGQVEGERGQQLGFPALDLLPLVCQWAASLKDRNWKS